MMTRKHYIEFAHILSDRREMVWDEVELYVIDAIENGMIQLFFEDNPNFDAQKFRRAASLDPHPLEAENT